jgi:recombinational DNA repair protein (RecF pathway)
LNFSPREGGLICDLCSKNIKDPLRIKVKEKDLLFLQKIEKQTFEEFLKENTSFSSKMETLFKNYIASLPSRIS